MARGSQVESRIVAILDEHRPLAGRIGRGGVFALVAIVGPIVLLAAGLRAADPPPQEQQAAAAKETVAAAGPSRDQSRTGETTSRRPRNRRSRECRSRGRVVLASDGSPAAGAEVRLLLNKPTGSVWASARTKTDEQGEFSFEDVPAGSHWLVAVLDGLASRRERQKATMVQVAADHPPEPVLLKLSPAPSIAVHVTVQGRWDAGGRRPGAADPDSQWEEQTDAQGSTVLLGVTPEVWDVEVQAEGFAEQTVP